jgi:tRNA1Val (adenine37-N6)-methyltransferase
MTKPVKKYQPFQFKQFSVDHNLCSMKVGVDGALLGAWANINECDNILDVGTGSGLIALMMAQRNQSANIEAIEIEGNAFQQAQINFQNSPWSARLHLHFGDFKNWNTQQKFDLIISNPPYFTASLKSEKEGRNLARHDDSLPLFELLNKAKLLLSNTGRICLVYPFDGLKSIEEQTKTCALYIKSITLVKPIISKPPKRILVEITRNTNFEVTMNELSIQANANEFTAEYIHLTQDFYLNF